MLTFIGGPAAGKRGLCIQRVPIYLRAVGARDGTWDVLNEPGDSALPDETIAAYKLVSEDGGAFIDGRDASGKRFGRHGRMATYAYIEPQPDEATMRDNGLWSEWAQAEYAKTEGDHDAE